MLGDISRVDHIYLACGYTDLRRGIDGLAQIVQQQFELDPFSNSLFLFCGKRRDRIKALLWEGDGIAWWKPPVPMVFLSGDTCTLYCPTFPPWTSASMRSCSRI